MATHRKTLLAQLAPMFGSQTENLAVEALGHILSGSAAARGALSELLEVGGAGIGQVAEVRTQDVGEDGARPDLVGADRDGKERVLIEAKFWAGLTENQPGGYLTRLASARQPSALLFVAPAQRMVALWAELCRLSETAPDNASELPMDEFRSARTSIGPYLMLTSWRSLLGRMAAKVSAAADSHAEIDIRQLRGLAEQQDAEAFLPLRREELGPQLPRRVIDLSGLVGDVIGRVAETEWVSIKGAKKTATATTYGIWMTFPRAKPDPGKTQQFFGVDYRLWAGHGNTPLWLGLHPSAIPRRQVQTLRQGNPLALLETSDWVNIPIELPVEKERGAVLDAVVARILEIAQLLAPDPGVEQLKPSGGSHED